MRFTKTSNGVLAKEAKALMLDFNSSDISIVNLLFLGPYISILPYKMP